MKLNLRIFLITAATIHAALLYLTLTRRLDFVFSDASHRMGPASDFLAMYLAGKYWTIKGGVYGHGPGFGFRYLPFTATSLFAWLSGLKPYAAYYVWVGIIECLVATFVVVLRRLISDNLHFAVACLVVVLFSPLYLDIFMGNSNVAVASLILLVYFLYCTGRNVGALTVFVIACLIKPIAIILLPLVAFRGGLKPVLVVAFVLAALSAPYFSQHADDLRLLVSQNLTDQKLAAGLLVHAGNQGFSAFLMRVGAAAESIPPTALSSVSQLPLWCNVIVYGWLVLLIVPAMLITWLQRHKPNIELLLFLYLSVYLLGYKDVWEHSYAILLCALPLLYLSRTVSYRMLLIGSALIALPTAFAMYDISFADVRMHDPDWNWSNTVSILHHATKPIGLLLLYGAAVTSAVRVALARRSESPVAGSSKPHAVNSV